MPDKVTGFHSCFYYCSTLRGLSSGFRYHVRGCGSQSRFVIEFFGIISAIISRQAAPVFFRGGSSRYNIGFSTSSFSQFSGNSPANSALISSMLRDGLQGSSFVVAVSSRLIVSL